MSKNIFIIFLLSLFIVVLLVSIAFFFLIYPNNQNGYMSSEQILALQKQGNVASIEESSNRIFINNSTNIVIEQSPGMGSMNSTPSEYFVIDGLINPTIVLKDGISIKFIIVNMDNMEHNFAITTIHPPYPYMIMGAGMMNYGGNFLLMSHYLPPYSGGNHYPYEEIYFYADIPGNYWYICTYPGHAEDGMYGQIIIN